MPTATRHKMSFVGHDRKVVIGLVDQGIDAWLEGFTLSQFLDDGHRLTCEIDPEKDMQVFLRRLGEHVNENPGDEQAETLLDDVVREYFLDDYEGY